MRRYLIERSLSLPFLVILKDIRKVNSLGINTYK